MPLTKRLAQDYPKGVRRAQRHAYQSLGPSQARHKFNKLLNRVLD